MPSMTIKRMARRMDVAKNVHVHVNAMLYKKALTIGKERGESFRELVERGLTELIYQDHIEKAQKRRG